MKPTAFRSTGPSRRTSASKPPLLHALAALLGAASLASAATVWTGPRQTFTKPDNADHTQAAHQDRLTPNVWITRGAAEGLFNIKSETAYTHNVSPADTEWATGTTASYSTLNYRDWENWTRTLGGPPSTVNVDAVMHLKSEDIYVDVKFTAWSARSGGGFAYQRSTPAPNVAPTVLITSPTNNATFTAPANVTVAVDVTDDGGVAAVEILDGTASLGMDTAAPYSLNVPLAPGLHALTAVATDNLGARSTSAVVNVSVTTVPIADPIIERISKGDLTIELRQVADGMISPLGMAVPDDGSGRMFVYDQVGVIWVVTPGGRLPAPMLDVRTRLMNLGGNYDERGLLGVACHPNFAQNPVIYTYTSETNGGPADFTAAVTTPPTNNHQSVIAEWRIDPAATNRVDPSTRREVLRIDEPQSNHNGGALRFGPDGLLYVTLGDGGQADDQGNGHSPGGNAQDTTNILGSIIRIDVDGSNSANGRYGVPLDNPFVGVPGVDEIYAYGLRNPFSFSFDRQTGELYLADVGQNKVEEINIITKGGNYGWNIKEGTFYFDPNGAGNGYVTTVPVRPVPPGLIDPIAQYDHDDGTAIIGGHVYRGNQLPALQGRYVFGDWGVFGSPSGRLYYLDAGNVIREFRIGLDDRRLGMYLKGFGEDASGELYVFASRFQGPAGTGGVMFKIVPPPVAPVAVSKPAAPGASFQANLSGGVGPTVLQKKSRVEEPAWFNELFTNGGPALVPQNGSSGFYQAVDLAQLPAVPFTAILNGTNGRLASPITGTGDGFGIFRLEGNALSFTLSYRGLTAPPTTAHIHGPARSTNNAGVLVGLDAYHNGPYSSNGGSYSGTIVLTDAQKVAVLAGLTYVNIHTPANPGGEIRGQVAPAYYQASLLPSGALTPQTMHGRGHASLVLVGNQLTYNMSYGRLSGAANNAHIHGPAGLGVNAGVLIGLPPYASSTYGTNGSISGSVTLSPSQLAWLVDGMTYVNVHTAAKPGGEIRGQILAQSTATPLTAMISGLNERPTPLTNTATGSGLFSLEGDRLAFNINYSGLTGPATDAHLHGAASSAASAGVQIPLGSYRVGSFGTNGSFSGSVRLTPTQRAMILNGQTYVNIHTAANPGGEARGQIGTVLMMAGATGTAERNVAVASGGSALGLFALAGSRLNLVIDYKGLSGAATAAHIHAAATTASGPVVLDFGPFTGGVFGASGHVTGESDLTPAVVNNLMDGLGYINFHTPTYGGGEIRGQIVR